MDIILIVIKNIAELVLTNKWIRLQIYLYIKKKSFSICFVINSYFFRSFSQRVKNIPGIMFLIPGGISTNCDKLHYLSII